ncbi:MAG: hypothetical protein K0A89_09645 [ANME-2 cluster archaeon]|nr:hypothetical protein [ANME-2 cluster archaeon]
MFNLKHTMVVLNGFIHDLATGFWLAAMIVIYSLHRFHHEYQTIAEPLNILERFFFWTTIAAVLIIFATGGIRSFTYVDNFYGEETEQARRKMLITKHVILLVIFGIGAYLGYSMAFH